MKLLKSISLCGFTALFLAAQSLAGDKNSKPDVKNMALIGAGEFMMGAWPGGGMFSAEPRHKVYLDAFYIYKYPVTVAQYRDFCKASGIDMPVQRFAMVNATNDQLRKFYGLLGKKTEGVDTHPVRNVEWRYADEYCKWAGGRLPTEAEWEKAARGGTDTKFCFGDNEGLLGEYTWPDLPEEGLHPVGRKKPNQYGVYDMHGNGVEWVSDWYSPTYYSNSPTKNPTGPKSGIYRVIRNYTSYARFPSLPDSKGIFDGFRCVVPAHGPQKAAFPAIKPFRAWRVKK